MRSIFTKIVVWSCSTLVLSLIAFFLVTALTMRRPEWGKGMLPRLQLYELSEVRQAYEARGPKGAGLLLDSLNDELSPRHYFLDRTGKDLVAGIDRSSLLAVVAQRRDGPVNSPDGLLTAALSDDGRYWLITVLNPPLDIKRFLPFYGLILFAVGLLSWPLATNIGRPLRTLATAVDRFGQGDLSVRIRSGRRDEIGNLAQSFDQMANRIETLLVAERRLLQDVSHELRSPLARLSFAAELARTAPDRDAAFDRVRKEISRLSELVATLLEVTRSEGDPSTRSRGIFYLGELLRDIVNDCSVETSERACNIALAETAPVALFGDKELIRRAIENVIRNAVYYSPAESTVEVASSSDSRYAHIWVRDRGLGIPEELLSKIFDPFFRVDDARNNSTGGLGLGLSIALRAVRVHNGEIRARNANPGLLVEIDLPLESRAIE
jgi:two-component system sensor histidine kinase CpxA